MIDRPDSKKFRAMIEEVARLSRDPLHCSPREAGIITGEAFNFVCEHYEKYIAALPKPVDNEKILDELAIIKHLLRLSLEGQTVVMQIPEWRKEGA